MSRYDKRLREQLINKIYGRTRMSPTAASLIAYTFMDSDGICLSRNSTEDNREIREIIRMADLDIDEIRLFRRLFLERFGQDYRDD